jgi:hypothetical protein
MRGLIITALALFFTAACGDGTHAAAPDLAVPQSPDFGVSSCANDLPTSCPSPAPSWDGGIEALISAKCLPCHNPSGQAYSVPLTDYSSVYARRDIVLNQVYSCAMPPAGADPLDGGERQTLVGWLNCGSPNN